MLIIDITSQHGGCAEQAACRGVGNDFLWRPCHVWIGDCGRCWVLCRPCVRGGEEQPEEGGDGGSARYHSSSEQVVVMPR